MNILKIEWTYTSMNLWMRVKLGNLKKKNKEIMFHLAGNDPTFNKILHTSRTILR